MDAGYQRVAQQLLRALRGGRSQAGVSRRLGFASNVSAKWESGQRMPFASDVLQHARLLGKDAYPALSAFNPKASAALGDSTHPDLASWLVALKGTQQVSAIAEHSGLSRFSVGRILAGRTEPRLPQFLALVDALTARLEDLVEAWVGVAHVPELQARHARSRAAREAMFQRPLCLAVMCLLDTRALDAPVERQRARLSRTLDIDLPQVNACLDTLEGGGVIRLEGDRYALSGALTIDAHSTREQERAARSFWTGIGHERSKAPGPKDVCSYNVFSISRADFARLEQLQREFYRGARALVAASEPTDVAGLLLVQLLAWDPEGTAS
jgi:DNA-binding phage protein